MQASHSHGLRDRGAAAVEFALVLPLLAAVTIGVISLGFALHVQTVLDNAAREAVRVAALSTASDRVAQARQAAITTAAPTVAVTAGDVTISPSLLCVRGTTVTATVEIDHRLIAGIGTITLRGQGTMRCGG